MKELAENPKIIRIELDTKIYALGEVTWNIDRIGSPAVWSRGYSGTGTQVAVLDTGIDYYHSDLNAGYAGGYDFVNKDADPLDDDGHGTHVAGIIAAVKNDDGVVGVAPGAKLYALKILDAYGSGYWSDAIAAIDWAVKGPDGIEGTADDAEVISMSFGANSAPSAMKQAVDTAYAKGIILVAAAGNDYYGVDYPAAFDSVIAVAATDINNNAPRWSSKGSQVELAAPGVSIYSTYPGGRYATMSGTSMACPHVSGAVALIKSKNPSLTPDQVRNILRQTADDLGTAGKDSTYGYGLVDIDKAIITAGGIVAQPPNINVVKIQAPSEVYKGDVFKADTTVQNTGDEIAKGVTVTIKLPADLSLASGESQTKNIGDIVGKNSASVSWNIVANSVGSYTITIEATSSNGGTSSASSTVSVKEKATAQVAIVDLYASDTFAGWYYSISSKIKNNGAQQIAVTLHCTIYDPSGIEVAWITKPQDKIVSVDPGATIQIQWKGKVPYGVKGGIYTAKVQVVYSKTILAEKIAPFEIYSF